MSAQNDGVPEAAATLLLFGVGILGVWMCSHSGWAVFWAVIAGCRVSRDA